MRVMSMRDLKLIPELSKYNEIELLHPSMDATIRSYLVQLGFDTEYDFEYVPSKHRDMQGKIAVGFQVVGEISLNRNFINSPMCNISERLEAAGYQDPSLTRELESMLGHSNGGYQYSEDAEKPDVTENEEVEDDYEWVSMQIKQLESIRDVIRGQHEN